MWLEGLVRTESAEQDGRQAGDLPCGALGPPAPGWTDDSVGVQDSCHPGNTLPSHSGNLLLSSWGRSPVSGFLSLCFMVMPCEKGCFTNKDFAFLNMLIFYLNTSFIAWQSICRLLDENHFHSGFENSAVVSEVLQCLCSGERWHFLNPLYAVFFSSEIFRTISLPMEPWYFPMTCLSSGFFIVPGTHGPFPIGNST